MCVTVCVMCVVCVFVHVCVYVCVSVVLQCVCVGVFHMFFSLIESKISMDSKICILFINSQLRNNTICGDYSEMNRNSLS